MRTKTISLASIAAMITLLLTQTAAWGDTFAPAASMSTPRAWHAATQLANGKVLVAGGVDTDYNHLATAERYDPASNSWSAAGVMSAARIHHTVTRLPHDQVLVTGGYNGGSYSVSAELYDSTMNSWRAAGTMRAARGLHTATLLPNGKVLVAGGVNNNNSLATAELYESNSWSTAADMDAARCFHTATLLPDGKVLVVGGYSSGNYLATAELYDPVTDSWSAAGSMTTGRFGHTATLLPNGKVLVAGGNDGSNYTATVELYDPASNSWSVAGTMGTARGFHSATLLLNGRVLLSGGDSSELALDTAELYEPTTNSWSVVGNMEAARGLHSAALLPGGKVLMAGGVDRTGVEVASAELFTPSTNSQAINSQATDNWSAAGPMGAERFHQTATLLASGKVLVAGGRDVHGNSISSAELYDPATNRWSAAGSMGKERTNHTATLLPGGKVLVAGGYSSDSGELSSAVLYDPATNRWSAAGTMGTARDSHTATQLHNGKVLVVGGISSNRDALAAAELYDPATNSWSAAGSMGTARASHTATLLPSGKVLVAGGGDLDCNAELYDPATNRWSAVETMGEVCRAHGHTATLLPSGKVLVAGGGNGRYSITTVELYDPSTNSLSTVGNMTSARSFHTATLLPSGQVLVAGGSQALSTAELYDPAINSWSSIGDMSTTRVMHTATLLATGRVLMAGGDYTISNGLSTAELYDTGLRAILSGNPARPVKAGTYPLSVGGDQVTAYMWRLNDGTWSAETPVSTNISVVTTTDGEYTVEVVGRDTAGNWQDLAFPTRVRWTVDTMAPDTAITGNPATFSQNSRPSFSFSSEKLASFECSTDLGDYVACTSPYTVAVPLNDGSHTFMVKARDLAENYDPTPASYTWTVDTLAPGTALTGKPSLRSNDQAPSFSFSSEAGATFECKLDLGAYAACTSPYTAVVSLKDGNHTFKVRAKDEAGNYDPTPASYTWLVDTVAPALSINPVAVTNRATKVISGRKAAGSRLTVSAPEGVSGSFSATTTAASTSWSCTISGYPANQLTTIDITATDAAGNSTTQSAVINYDTLAPAAVITGTPASPVKAGTYRLVVGGDQVTAYKWRLNGGLWSAVTPVDARISVAATRSRTYTVEVIGKDASGNWQDKVAATTASWTVDTLAPGTTLTDKPAARSNNQTPSFGFSSEAGASFECKLDLGVYAACTSPYTVATTLNDGSHTFRVRAKDLAGNFDPTPVSYTWTVDTK